MQRVQFHAPSNLRCGTDGTFVAIDPDVDDGGWDADDEESDGDDDEERGWNQADGIDPGHRLHSILPETRAMEEVREWNDWVWKDGVTDFHLRHGDSLDHASAFEELLGWNPWTGPWESSSNGLYGVTGLGLTMEGRDILQFGENQAIPMVDNDRKPIDRRALKNCASPSASAETMPREEANTSWYDSNRFRNLVDLI